MKKIAGLLFGLIILAVVLGGVISFAGGGFRIRKVDDSGKPVEGAVFDVYGRPEVSWEKIPTEPCVGDPPVEKKVIFAEGTEMPDTAGHFSFTMEAADPSWPMVPGSTEGKKTLTISGDGPFTESEVTLSGELGDITFIEAGPTTIRYMRSTRAIPCKKNSTDRNTLRTSTGTRSSSSAKTGDTTHLLVCAVTAVIALAVIFVLLKVKKGPRKES